MSRAPSKPTSPRPPRSERGLALDGPRRVVEAIAASDALGGIALGPARVSHARWLYHDTESGALTRAGVTLGVTASGDGFLQELDECRDPPAGGYFERTTDASRVPSPEPDLMRIAHAELAARTRALCAEEPLVVQLEVESTQTTRRIRLDGAAIEVCFAVGEARVAEGATPLARISFVSRSGVPAALFRAALSMQEKHPELRPASDDTARLLARLRGEVRAAGARPIVVEKDATLDALMAAVLGECLRCVARNEPAARLAQETEGLHQMRIGLRRARSALRMFRDELPRERAEWLRAALAPLADALGAARDLDVFLALIAACEASGATGLAALRASVSRARAEAFADAVHLLDSPDRARLDLELGLLVFGCDWRDPARAERLAMSAQEAARELGARADRRARRAGRGFAGLTPEQAHRLRLRVKAARYVVDSLAPLLPEKRAKRYVGRARALQDALGVESDAARTRSLVARFEGASPSAPYLLGYSAGSVAESRGERERAWRRFRAARRPWA